MKNLAIKVNNKTKIIISSLAVIILCVVAYYFAIYNSLQAIKETEDKIIVQKIEQDKKYSESISQKQLIGKMKMVESQLKKVDSIFINKDRMLDFVTTIEGIAAANKVNQTINISDSADKSSGFSKNILNLAAKGNYKNILNFLEDLESLNYYINIDILDVQKTQEDIFMNITAEFYGK